jgi:hypothetical protein
VCRKIVVEACSHGNARKAVDGERRKTARRESSIVNEKNEAQFSPFTIAGSSRTRLSLFTIHHSRSTAFDRLWARAPVALYWHGKKRKRDEVGENI